MPKSMVKYRRMVSEITITDDLQSVHLWRSREYIVLMGYFGYCGSFVLQPQCVACSVAGVIS